MMNFVLPYDSWLTLSLQNTGDYFIPVMQLFTWLGYPQAYMIMIAIIYWSVDRKLGLRMAIFLTVVASINSILKQALHAPRPYWIDPRIKAIHAPNGFGMPSGHAQAVTVWLYIANSLKNGWFWSGAIIVTLMVGLSRVYLGVHFPSQVLAGWLIGIIVIILFVQFESKVVSLLESLRIGYQLFFVFGVSMLFLLLGGILVFMFQNWEMPVEWIRNASLYLTGENETTLSSISMEAIASNAGGFMGAAMGAILIRRKGGFDAGGILWKRLIRSITGIVLILLLYLTIKMIAPDQEEVLLYSMWRFAGFFIILFSEIFLIPLLFIRINLFPHSSK
jgi:membrane-associated phospholipid phosphatase